MGTKKNLKACLAAKQLRKSEVPESSSWQDPHNEQFRRLEAGGMPKEFAFLSIACLGVPQFSSCLGTERYDFYSQKGREWFQAAS
jgi:hypothetical protein